MVSDSFYGNFYFYVKIKVNKITIFEKENKPFVLYALRSPKAKGLHHLIDDYSRRLKKKNIK